MFRPPKARKCKASSRIDEDCRKNAAPLNSNRAPKAKPFDAPKILPQVSGSVHETDTGSNKEWAWGVPRQLSARATPLSLFSKTNQTLGFCDKSSTMTRQFAGVDRPPSQTFAAGFSQNSRRRDEKCL